MNNLNSNFRQILVLLFCLFFLSTEITGQIPAAEGLSYYSPFPARYNEYYINKTSLNINGLNLTFTLYQSNVDSISLKHTITYSNYSIQHIYVSDDFFGASIYTQNNSKIMDIREKPTGLFFTVPMFNGSMLQEKWYFGNNTILNVKNLRIRGIFFINKTSFETEPILFNDKELSSENYGEPLISMNNPQFERWVSSLPKEDYMEVENRRQQLVLLRQFGFVLVLGSLLYLLFKSQVS